MCRRDEEIHADASRVLDAARGRRFGSIEVLDGEVTIDADWRGGDGLFFDLVVSSPPRGLLTWPREDREAVYAFVAERVMPWLDRGWMHYVRLHDGAPVAYEPSAKAG